MLSTSGCAATRTTQSAGEYVDDAAITTSVKAALLAEDDVKSLDINVETFRGDVQLSGFVNSAGQIDKAVATARRQNGVKNVKNAMRIKTAD
ncbi:MAG: BON domain-containing protein [Gammaproteobacteria bacterium]|nr:BON domain-containing protein [Gammaproteobacteria bacterium]